MYRLAGQPMTTSYSNTSLQVVSKLHALRYFLFYSLCYCVLCSPTSCQFNIRLPFACNDLRELAIRLKNLCFTYFSINFSFHFNFVNI